MGIPMALVGCDGMVPHPPLISDEEVTALLTRLEPEMQEQLSGTDFEAACDETFASLDESGLGVLRGEALRRAVVLTVPENFRHSRGLYSMDVERLILSFDQTGQGQI